MSRGGNPHSGEWVAQQARNLAWKLQDGALAAKFLLHDRDTKFTAAFFDQVFQAEGAEIVKLPFRSPRANSIPERLVGTARRELLDHLLIFGKRHLEYVLKEFVHHYHHERPHRSLGLRFPYPSLRPATGTGPVVRHDRLGGLLHQYSRAA